MLTKLKTIDYITSLVATFLWFLGGLGLLVITRAVFLSAIPLGVRNNNKSTLGALFLLLIFCAFILGAWLAVSKLLPLFMAKTKQANVRQTVSLFLKLSAISILGLLFGNTIGRDTPFISYGFWIIGLVGIYLFARYRIVK